MTPTGQSDVKLASAPLEGLDPTSLGPESPCWLLVNAASLIWQVYLLLSGRRHAVFSVTPGSCTDRGPR